MFSDTSCDHALARMENDAAKPRPITYHKQLQLVVCDFAPFVFGTSIVPDTVQLNMHSKLSRAIESKTGSLSFMIRLH